MLYQHYLNVIENYAGEKILRNLIISTRIAQDIHEFSWIPGSSQTNGTYYISYTEAAEKAVELSGIDKSFSTIIAIFMIKYWMESIHSYEELI